MAFAIAAASMAFAGDQSALPDFSDLSLDQLANVKVTSFTKKQQELSQVAGAVYVITQEQIVRSGLTSVPELLRLAPGIDVARVNGNQWSISARGPVGVYSDKLLVLIDGRSIYSPVFSGVYWELGMPPLDDIDRIEVIRGPGATIWGANAVLGVINIITRSARETHGMTITSEVGNSDRAYGGVRMGGALGAMNYRAYASGSDDAPLRRQSGAAADDGWTGAQGGFRLDGLSGHNNWMLEGDLSRTTENETGLTPSLAAQSFISSPSQFRSVSANVTGEWRRHLSDNRELRIESYWSLISRPEPQNSLVETKTGDADLQYDFTVGRIHNVSVGGGARVISASVGQTGEVLFSPADLTYANLNTFAQDELHLAHDRLRLTFGAKLEHNHFGGWGTEPSANLLWMPSKRHSIWISAARSLRTPSLFETEVNGPFDVVPASPATSGLPVFVSVGGAPAFMPERVNDYEFGYRAQLSKKFSVDLVTYYDRHSNLRSDLPGAASLQFDPVLHIDASFAFANLSEGTGKGAEASLAWQVLPAWKLEGSYDYSLFESWMSPSAPPLASYADGNPPAHTKVRLQSYINLSRAWKVDSFLYWTSRPDGQNVYGPPLDIPSYARLDLRLGFKASRHWQLSLAGQNLLQARHLEGIPEYLTIQSYVNRAVSLRSTWQF